jgi:hypothetical protein
LVERDLPKVDVASSSLVIRSIKGSPRHERDTLPDVDVASSSLVIRSIKGSPRHERDTLPDVDVASSSLVIRSTLHCRSGPSTRSPTSAENCARALDRTPACSASPTAVIVWGRLPGLGGALADAGARGLSS